jgi:hypothetical protein
MSKIIGVERNVKNPTVQKADDRESDRITAEQDEKLRAAIARLDGQLRALDAAKARVDAQLTATEAAVQGLDVAVKRFAARVQAKPADYYAVSQNVAEGISVRSAMSPGDLWKAWKGYAFVGLRRDR